MSASAAAATPIELPSRKAFVLGLIASNVFMSTQAQATLPARVTEAIDTAEAIYDEILSRFPE